MGLNMSRSLGDSKLHAVGVSDVPDVQTIFLEAAKASDDAAEGAANEAKEEQWLGTCGGMGRWKSYLGLEVVEVGCGKYDLEMIHDSSRFQMNDYECWFLEVLQVLGTIHLQAPL